MPAAPEMDEKELDRFQAIIQSMTLQERRDPSIINGSRRRRIARGSGTSVQQVNQLLKQFEMMRRMFGQISKMQPGALPGKGGKKRFGIPRMPFMRG
jgi:signal recognition particle subunit SRP54